LKILGIVIGIIIGICAILVLVIFGWQITKVSIPLGPVKVEMENPSSQSGNDQSQSNPATATQPLVSVNPTQITNTQPAGPTSESVDFNPPLSLPFYDNFDQGPDKQWRISGNYLITSGTLAGADTVTLEIGNNSLGTYLVEFDIISTNEFCSWSYYDTLTIGVTPTLQYRAMYTDMYSRGTWYALKDGQWQELIRDEIGVVSNNSCKNRVRVTVNGNSYKIYANGGLITEIVYGNSTGASFMIGTTKTPQIDNLVISQP
jgi:hypothetical protein